jgi:hypothetical protein
MVLIWGLAIFAHGIFNQQCHELINVNNTKFSFHVDKFGVYLRWFFFVYYYIDYIVLGV